MYKNRLLKDYGRTLYTISENGEATVYDFTNYTFDPGIYYGMSQYEVDNVEIVDHNPIYKVKHKSLKDRYYVYFDGTEGSYSITKCYEGPECLVATRKSLAGAEAVIQSCFDNNIPEYYYTCADCENQHNEFCPLFHWDKNSQQAKDEGYNGNICNNFVDNGHVPF